MMKGKVASVVLTPPFQPYTLGHWQTLSLPPPTETSFYEYLTNLEHERHDNND